MPVKVLDKADFRPKPADELAGLFGRKVPLGSREFDTLKRESRARAFRVLGVNKVQLVQRAMAEVQKGIRDGLGIREIQLRLMRIFSEEGVQAPPMHYLRLVMRQNQLGTYNIARKRMLDSPAVTAALPYRMYLTVGNGRPGVNNVRDEHAKFHGLVFAWDDPFWDHFHPPWGWNCRCFTRAVSRSEVERSNLTVWSYAGGSLRPADPESKAAPVEAEPDPEFDFERDQLFERGLLQTLDPVLRGFLDDLLEKAERDALKN
jgi:SPP1 gp7 family putative phage head morphogenesis protein